MSAIGLRALAGGAAAVLLAAAGVSAAGQAVADSPHRVASSAFRAVNHGAASSVSGFRAALPPKGYGTGTGYCTSYAGGVTSSYSFENVYACEGTTTGSTTFDQPGNIYAWQCVELSARFLWAIDGIWAGPGSGVQDGAEPVSVVHANDGTPVGSPGPGSVPAPGDVISLGPGGGSDPTFGHTAVVISADAATG